MRPDKPIVTDLDKVDFYKPKMGQFILQYFPSVWGRFAFKNRHADRVPLQRFIDIGELKEQVAHARTLRHQPVEIDFLRGSKYIPRGTFKESYLAFMETYRLPEPDIEITPDLFRFEVEDQWLRSSPWETIAMNIINQLYYRRLMKDAGLTLEDVWIEGERRLREKIAILKAHPWIKFSSFMLRRAFANVLLDRIDAILAEEVPDQLMGISDWHNARILGKKPVGTIAHEMFMGKSAYECLTDEDLRHASPHLLEQWIKMYGPEGTTAIPDTFGSESFLTILFGHYPELAKQLIAYKIDSGDPIERGELHIRAFADGGLDPLSRKLLFCDGLDVPTMIKLYDHFKGRVGLAPFGPGTNFSNDFGPLFRAVSMVMKLAAVKRNGVWIPCVKLSDNLEKASGPEEEIDRYVRAHGYHNEYRATCVV